VANTREKKQLEIEIEKDYLLYEDTSKISVPLIAPSIIEALTIEHCIYEVKKSSIKNNSVDAYNEESLEVIAFFLGNNILPKSLLQINSSPLIKRQSQSPRIQLQSCHIPSLSGKRSKQQLHEFRPILNELHSLKTNSLNTNVFAFRPITPMSSP